MDPNPAKFPILSYVMQKLPSFKHGGDPEEAPPQLEISEKMPELKDPKLISAMRWAVSDVSQTRSVLQALGPRPDREVLESARGKVAEMGQDGGAEYQMYKGVISLDEMHEAYERMLADAEAKLERIYVAGAEEAEKVAPAVGVGVVEEEATAVDEEVVAILKEVEKGKRNTERVDLSGRDMRALPEEFGRVKSLVVLNLSNNQLKVLFLLIM